jgi:hypothetical protein
MHARTKDTAAAFIIFLFHPLPSIFDEHGAKTPARNDVTMSGCGRRASTWSTACSTCTCDNPLSALSSPTPSSRRRAAASSLVILQPDISSKKERKKKEKKNRSTRNYMQLREGD